MTTGALTQRLAARLAVDGVVVRTPSHQTIEALAARGTTCVMIDTEHAPIGPQALDAMLAVSCALGLDALVRVPAGHPPAIQQALDGGATGVVVPHVVDAATAERAVAAAHYGPGGRGFSGSTRSVGWGTRTMAAALAAAAARTVVIAQIEDRQAVEHAGAIAATDGIDAVFIGLADLAVSLGATSPDDAAVTDAAAAVLAAAVAVDRSVVVVATTGVAAAEWRRRGANVILHDTDQSRLSATVD